MDIARWLDGLGLGDYGPAFAENHIERETLPTLTAEDLKELGVASLGHRKKILTAIAALGADGPDAASIEPEAAGAAPSSYTPRHLADRILTSRAALEGERKQVTVLFADIKGSLELIERSDPEEAHRLLDSLIRAMMDAVHRYEGTVNKVLGDGVMALFGAPLAHEDHATRACYAALAMQEAVGRAAEQTRHSHGVEPQIRVGLNSGEVVVRAIGNDLSMDYDAIGLTTHLAGRMEQLAVPGTIRLTQNTLRLAEGFVRVKPLGPVPIKGIDRPVEIHELVGATQTHTRFQAAVARGLTRFVGRDTEMAALGRALERAVQGHGQAFAVVGEAGVGKSRLCHEFTHSHRTSGMLILESRSVSYGKATAYLPVIDLLKGYFDIGDRDDARRVREQVTGKLLTLDEGLRPALPALLALLDVPAEESDWDALEPSQRRRRTLDAVKGLLLRESQVQPLVILFEDLHWIDGETQAFLDSLIESLPAAPILVLVNYRPEYRHAWGNRTYYNQRRIDPLPPDSAAELLDGLLGADAVLAPLKQMLITRTEGNPFYVEESVRTLVETGALAGGPGAYRPARDVASVDVPATVQGVLAARIDRLAPEDKRLLQTASVIGKDVSFTLLEAIADLPGDELRSRLAGLQSAEFLYETRLFPDPEYTFKHALTHEVTYVSLLQERRRVLHRRIAEAIETIHAGRVADQCERLAHHYTEAGLAEKAVPYWLQAGQRAVEQSANAEAIAHLETGLELIRNLPATPDRQRLEISLLVTLGIPLQAVAGASSPEVERVYGSALELCRQAGEAPLLFPALWGLWRFHRSQSDLATARGLADQLLDLAERQDDATLRLQAHHAQWTTLYFLGEFEAARGHVDRGLALYDPNEHSKQAFLIGGHDPFVCGQGTAALILWLHGYPDAAVEKSRQTRAFAESLGQPSSLALALEESALLRFFRREEDRLDELTEPLMAVAREWDLSHIQTSAEVLQGWVQVQRGHRADGVRRIRKALDARRSAGLRVEEAHLMGALVDALRVSGEAASALVLLDGALARAEQRGVRYWLAEFLRLRGELMLAASEGPGADAESWFKRGLDVARVLGVRSLELRAATSLARLWARQGKSESAKDLLGPIHGAFTEGSETADLREAKSVLDSLC